MNVTNKIIQQDLSQALVARLNAAVLMVDVSGVVVASSARAMRELVANGEALVGQKIGAFLCEADAPRFHSWLRDKVCADPDDNVFNLARDFASVPYQIDRITDQHGDVTGLVFQAGDNGAELNENREDVLRWRTAIECADQCTWDHDFSKDRHFVSDAWREMRGWSDDYSPEESTEDWLKTIHPDDVAVVVEQIKAQESGATDDVKYEFRQRHAGGHWIWILSRGRVVHRDENGMPDRIVGIDLDITDMKNTENDRHRIGERLAVAMDAAQMAHWELKIGAKTTYWDNRALAIFGIKDGINERDASDFENALHPDDRAATMEYWHACMVSKLDVKCDFRIITPCGEERYIRTSGSYVSDGNGDGRYCGVNLDLTDDRKKTLSLEQAGLRMAYESRHDALTGLANRRHLDEVFKDIQGDLNNRAAPPAAMHIDIDHFKTVNDTLGHDAGDAALQKVASVLIDQMPSDVLVARVGGDEFVVLFPEAPAHAQLRGMAKALIKVFATPFEYAGGRCKIGISIGIANYSATAKSNKALFINADLALYQAKRAGRGTFRHFNAQMQRDATNRHAAQDRLRHAIEQGELICFYQPQFDAVTLELSGLEALVRWDSPELGLLTPDVFLDTADELGLTATIDALVLAQALRNLDEWETSGRQVPRISVNISAQRIADPTLGDTLKQLSIPRGKIAFELLESTFLDMRNDDISDNLDVAHALGIDIEIDDFGTGHASIVSLLQIEPARLKLDRELVDPILASTKRKRLLKSLISIGKMLNIKVVAEGVETLEHAKVLGEMGCDHLQGYALGRPMPHDQITPLLTVKS